MRFFGVLFFLLIIFCDHSAFAQKSGDLTQSRILILLDQSSSMIQTWGNGKPKYKAADELILRLMDSIYAVNSDVEFSLRVFGHQHTVAENNCHDTKNEVPFSKNNRVQMAFRLDDIHPLGVTAIAYSLQQAAEYDLPDEQHNAYSIILITDGGESCGGDICAVMDMLRKNKIYFKPYIVSLEDYPELKNTYACMGDYLQVTRDGDIPVAVNTIVNAFRPIIKITPTEYKRMQTIVANAPSVLKVNVPTVKEVDTPKAVVVKKDTVAAPKAAPVHKIKVDEVKPVPKPEKISRIAPKALRPIFIAGPTATNQMAASMKISLPPVKEEAPVIVKAAPEKIARLKPGTPKNFTIYSHYDSPNLNLTLLPSPKLPPIIYDIPKPEKIARLATGGNKPVAIHSSTVVSMQPMAGQPKLPPVKVDTPKPIVEVKKPVAEKIARIKPNKLRTINVVWVVEERNIMTRTPPPLPPLKIDIPKLPVGKKPTAEKIPEGKKLDYDIKIEDAQVTSLEIYIVNSKGQLVSTTPQVALINPATNTEVKRFYRTVDDAGNPDPQESIPLGTYSLTFPAKKDLIIPNVKLEKNKRNKITIRIPDVSLGFVYFGAPDRPVKEFGARVIERNKRNGRVQDQLCITKLEYEPGNYHIRINTLPEDVRNVDLDLDGETLITILQPGFAKFTSDTRQIVSLWKEDGNKFRQFYQLDLNDPRSLHLQIQPGKYQVHYRKGPGGPAASTKVKLFVITSNKETEIILD